MSKTTFKGSIMLNPVPSVLITSRNSEGKDNIFTVGWIGTACTKPPMITLAIRPERLSYDYIKEGNSFVVNLASTNLVKTVDYCGVRSGRNTNKFKDMNLTLSEAKEINCGIIDQCPVSFECVVKSITPLGTHDLFLAEIVNCHVDDNLIDRNGKIHFEKADLLTYSHGEYFAVNPTPLGKFGFSVAKNSSSSNKGNTTNSTNVKSDSVKTSSSTVKKHTYKNQKSNVKVNYYSEDSINNKSNKYSKKGKSHLATNTENTKDSTQKSNHKNSSPEITNNKSSRDECYTISKLHNKNNKSNKSKKQKLK